MNTERNIRELTVENLQKLNSICRICLNENTYESVSLFSLDDTAAVYQEIMLCARVKIKANDGLPNIICKSCHIEFEAANTFRLKCENSDSILRKYYFKKMSESELKYLDPDKIELPCKTNKIYDVTESDNSIKFVKSTEKMYCSDEVNLVKPESHPYENLNVKLEENSCIESVDSPDLYNTLEESLNNANDDDLKIEKDMKEDNWIERLDSPDLYNALNERLNNDNDDDIKIERDSNGLYSCTVCGKPLKSKVSLERHLENMHKKRSNQGTVTGYGAQRRFHCTVCDYSTKHSQSLVYHSRIHTGERPYRCDICDKTFTQPGSLSGHRKKHSNKMYYTCSECGKQFKYKDTYERHKNVHITEKKFICSICNKGLKSAATLEGHMNRHYNIKNYSCEVCGATFVTKVELLNHNKKHIADRRFQCNLCEYKTYMKKGLEVHLKRHSGDRPFKCDQCEVACYTNGELKCHIRKHTRERNYACPLCSLHYMHSSSVNKHMRKTHGVKYLRNDTIDRRIVK